jgi:putative FmdB family regulatory protein
MPTYDYVCDACGHAFEHFQSMAEKRLSTCPKCKKRKLVRQIGAGGGVIFKGSGFYQTDYKAKSPEAVASRTAAEKAAAPEAAGCGKDACKATPGTCAAADATPATPAPAKSAKSSKASKA